MTRNDFIFKVIVAMASNSCYRYNWHSRNDWADEIIAAAKTLADRMKEKGLLINSESDGDG